MPANFNNRRLTDSKQSGRRVTEAHTDRKSRCQMHPIERSLCVRKPRLQTAKDIRIWSCAEADTVHYAGKVNVRLRRQKNVCPHAGLDMLERTFAKIADCPPCARVDECEHLLAYVRVGALRDRKVRHTRIEWRIDPAITEIVAGSFYCRCAGATLVDKRFERGHGMYRLLMLGMALFQDCL